MASCINNGKILVVYNNLRMTDDFVDSAEPANFSESIADWYMLQRTNLIHKLGVNMGTVDRISLDTQAERDNFYNAVLLPIGKYIRFNAIQCVLLSAGCPYRANLSGNVPISMDNLIGMSPWYHLTGGMTNTPIRDLTRIPDFGDPQLCDQTSETLNGNSYARRQ